ncbi:dihydrolipoyl dehydrogenase [Ohessyouella blattaphilus]|uniref:Dihydrolipoyl dehydrogenase n=1 Tax=Ohessyouella blattaphilus TaxID=2949333 RepID=A0ABT1EGP0_9FIRM|nr:dihydrolipoyl dehydrogenase [Ohessyouella blattaphilus]MCP1108927.1 dihydrolipoyl dehydrogenase [Ohessyouella blattaphilus]MCR8562321.1 dihydrolipoyl dehydrogenase [Ohessyouella blattaphilus]MDL2249022.1 dihydrolipoyl dehydrogenase [Lachnospiraceae bacterium OttesenSCG-928-J05]
MSEKIYDLIVIGGGPGGYYAAIKAAKAGLSVLVFEGENVGGTCLNVGCIPTKYLLDKASAMERVRALTGQKIFREPGLFSFRKIQEGRVQVVNKLVGGVDHLLKSNQITVIRKFATMKKAGEVQCEDIVYKGKDVIIATGSVPTEVPIPGAEYTINSTQMLSIERVPSKLTVIGGGVIGMELASAFHSFGSEVTVIEVLSTLFPGEDEKIISFMTKELKRRGINILCGTRVKAISQKGAQRMVTYEGEENGEVTADVVLMATGRKANLRGIEVESIGIELNERGEIKVNEYLQSSVSHVYAIGDAIGGFQLAHAAYAEGEAAVDHILGKEDALDESVMPRCIYTIPAMAAVGITEKQANERGIETVTGSFSYGANGMALAEGAQGLVLVVMDKKKKTTLGVHITGECAPELISFAGLAVQQKLTLEEWEKLIVAHPSLSEMIKEAALDCFGKNVHGS